MNKADFKMRSKDLYISDRVNLFDWKGEYAGYQGQTAVSLSDSIFAAINNGKLNFRYQTIDGKREFHYLKIRGTFFVYTTIDGEFIGRESETVKEVKETIKEVLSNPAYEILSDLSGLLTDEQPEPVINNVNQISLF